MRYSTFPSPPSIGDFIKLQTVNPKLFAQSITFFTAAYLIFLSLTIPFLFKPLLPHSNCGFIKLIKKVLKKGKAYTKEEKSILLQQLIYAPSGIIYLCFVTGIAGAGGVCTFGKAAFSGIMVGVMAMVSLANSIFLCYNTVRVKNMKKGSAVKQYLWIVLGVFYFMFIVVFQLYNFWNL